MVRPSLKLIVALLIPREKVSSLSRSISSRRMPQQGQKRTRETGGHPLDAYFFSDGLRHVKPYVYDFRTNAKGRWYGRELLEVFVKEFATQPASYYETAIRQGLITVNDKVASIDYKIRSGDSITHFTHRHEPPVRGTHVSELQIVADTPELLVVSKPATVPVHP